MMPLMLLVEKRTHETYGQFQTAYDNLNSELFENKLPRCLITLQRQRSSYGYFSAGRFGRKDGERTDEIALNPQHLAERPVEDSLSTLGHERSISNSIISGRRGAAVITIKNGPTAWKLLA